MTTVHTRNHRSPRIMYTREFCSYMSCAKVALNPYEFIHILHLNSTTDTCDLQITYPQDHIVLTVTTVFRLSTPIEDTKAVLIQTEQLFLSFHVVLFSSPLLCGCGGQVSRLSFLWLRALWVRRTRSRLLQGSVNAALQLFINTALAKFTSSLQLYCHGSRQ